MLGEIVAAQRDLDKGVVLIVVGGVLVDLLCLTGSHGGMLDDFQNGAGAVDGDIAQDAVLAADQIPDLVQHGGGQHGGGRGGRVGKGGVLQGGHFVVLAQQMLEERIMIGLAPRADVLALGVFQVQQALAVHSLGQLAVVAHSVQGVAHLLFLVKLGVQGLHLFGLGLGLLQLAVVDELLRGIQQRLTVVAVVRKFHCVLLSVLKY